MMMKNFYRLPVIIILIIAWMTLAPFQVGGAAGYVIVAGASMQPALHRGDLVITRRAQAYHIGDVVAYRHPDIGAVLHRIADQVDGRFVLKGDNNTWLDGYQPTAAEVLGKLWLHWPGVGRLIESLRRPWIMVALVVIGGVIGLSFISTPPGRRARRPKIRIKAMKEIDYRQDIAFVLIVLFIGGLVLGWLSFSRPAQQLVADDMAYQHRGQFTYVAPAPTGVYDGEMVRTGEPLFARLSQRMTLSFDYLFVTSVTADLTGSYRLLAQVRHLSGWKRTIEIVPPTAFAGTSLHLSGEIDLGQMQAWTMALEAQTGLQRQRYTLSLLPQIDIRGTLDGQPIESQFTPSLDFYMDMVQISLPQEQPDQPNPLLPVQKGAVPRTRSEPNTMSVLGLTLPVWSGRWIAILVVLLALAGQIALAWLGAPSHTGWAAYRRLIVHVQAGQPTPASFIPLSLDDLARLTERIGGVMLHYDQGQEHLFIVQDSQTTYGCRSATENPPAVPNPIQRLRDGWASLRRRKPREQQ